MKENRLIDANALKDLFLQDHCGDNFLPKHYVIATIDNAPTIKSAVVPVCEIKFEKEQLQECVDKAKAEVLANIERPQGEWKLIRVADHCGIHDSFVCPFCNYEREYRKKNFCEECGADLRGDDNG